MWVKVDRTPLQQTQQQLQQQVLLLQQLWVATRLRVGAGPPKSAVCASPATAWSCPGPPARC